MIPATLDIVEGDIFVCGREYKVRAASLYKASALSASSFLKIAGQTTAYTKRSYMEGGKIGQYYTYLTDLSCTPVDEVDPETQRQLVTDAPLKLFQTTLQYGTPPFCGFMTLILEALKAKP